MAADPGLAASRARLHLSRLPPRPGLGAHFVQAFDSRSEHFKQAESGRTKGWESQNGRYEPGAGICPSLRWGRGQIPASSPRKSRPLKLS